MILILLPPFSAALTPLEALFKSPRKEEKPPTLKSPLMAVSFGYRVQKTSPRAPKIQLRDTPANKSVDRPALIFLLKTTTKRDETRAPQNAEIDIVQGDIAPRTKATTTISPAPELTPIIPGAANLFPNTL